MGSSVPNTARWALLMHRGALLGLGGSSPRESLRLGVLVLLRRKELRLVPIVGRAFATSMAEGVVAVGCIPFKGGGMGGHRMAVGCRARARYNPAGGNMCIRGTSQCGRGDVTWVLAALAEQAVVRLSHLGPAWGTWQHRSAALVLAKVPTGQGCSWG